MSSPCQVRRTRPQILGAPLLVFAAFLATLGAPPEASASCNAIAPAKALGTVTAERVGFSENTQSTLAHRGAVGRINRIYLPYSTATEVVVGPDTTCGAPELVAPLTESSEPIMRPDQVVVSIYYGLRTGSPARVRRYASPTICAELDEATQGNRLEMIGACSNEGVRFEQQAGEFRLHVPVLPLSAPVTGPVTFVALRAGDGALERLRTVDANLSESDCAAYAERFESQASGLVCIDKIYADVARRELCELTALAEDVEGTASDPWACDLAQLPPATELKDQCACACSDPNSNLCKCSEPDNCPTALSDTTSTWYVDECTYGIHAEFDWTDVYVDAGRIVAGFGAAGKKSKKKDSPSIQLPGREFLGSTRPGPGNVGNPRLPIFKPVKPAPPAQLGLTGLTHEEASVLHIFPRLPVRQICKNDLSTDGEACVGILEDTSGGYETCPCDIDRPFSNCEICTPVSQVKTSTYRYYVCRGGTYAGRPCTRPAHCEGGTCDGQPDCETVGTVWENAKDASGECWNDGMCEGHAGGKTQCGPLLFDFVSKIDDATTRYVTLERKVKSTGKDRRGVCENKPTEACDKTSACSANADCLGYALKAGETLP